MTSEERLTNDELLERETATISEVRHLRAENARLMGEAAALRRQVEELRTALKEAVPEEYMEQDEQGGCVWCGYDPGIRYLENGVYAPPRNPVHDTDCPWVKGRHALAALAALEPSKEEASKP